MSTSFTPTNLNAGVRRIYTLSGFHGMKGTAGVATLGQETITDLLDNMIADGYDENTLMTLISLGATYDQILNLYDNYGANTPELAVAEQALVNQLSPAAAGVLPPQSTVSSIAQTVYGAFDLSTQAAWNQIAALFSQTQTNLQTLARVAPNDAQVIAYVQQFNSLAQQYASYYQQAFGSAPAGIPNVTLGGLGQVVLIAAGVVAAIIALLGSLYLLNQNIAAKTAQIQATGAAQVTATQGTLANTYASLVAQAQAATAAGNTALAAQLNAQAAAALTAAGSLPAAPSTTLTFSQWFQANWGWMALLVGAIVIVPAVMPGGRRR